MQLTTPDSSRKKGSIESIIGRKMPSSIEAEKAVLGALLLNDEQLSAVVELLVPKDFYMPAHIKIFDAMNAIAQRSERLDIVTLQNEMEKRNTLHEAGGLVYFLSLQEDIPSVGLILQHAHIIKEKAILRDLISSATSIIAGCYNQEDDDIKAVLDFAEKTIFQIANKRTDQNFIQLTIWLKKTFQHLSDIKSNSGGLTGLSSGYKNLDKITSGFQNGDLIILAARPSMGKTALALNIASHVAETGITVGVFSLEMAAEQLTLRLLSAESNIAHHTIRNATISSDEWIDLTHVAGQLASRKLFIDDTAGIDIMTLRAKARKLKMQENVGFLVIDYLQLIHGGRRHENRHQEVSEISRALKALAKELNIPIVALSQLSRAVDSRMDKRPILSDLRESGAIEQDADLIMFLYRDCVYNPDTDNPSLAELIVSKQRNGPTGVVHLTFLKELTKFEDCTDSY